MNNEDEQPRHNYTGPINVGDRFVWEPTLPDARQQIIVTRINNEWIETEDTKGDRHWNEESRFREAVERDDAPLTNPTP